MLAKAVVRTFGERAEFVEETFSESVLAKKFGIRLYPAIFVNEVLIAKPSDFFGNTEGRYVPWREPKNQEKFRSDLTRMVEIALRDASALAKEGVAPDAVSPNTLARMPEFSLSTIDGKVVDDKSLAGRITIVEFWAEWCPPCRSTLSWMKDTHRKLGASLNLVGLAIESDEANIKEIARSMDLDYPIAMASKEVALAFGDVVAVPTLYVFGRDLSVANIFYGAPPDLHEQVGKAITAASK